MSSGSFCIPLEQVGGDIYKCADHCQVQMASEGLTLASAATDAIVFQECCCYEEDSCRCRGKVGGFPLPANVLMLPGHELPDEECPISRVEGGYG